MEESSTWKSVFLCAAGALALLVLADVLLARVAPTQPLRELRDGISDFRAGDPEILVLGSSHGRTFHVLGQELSRRRGAPGLLVSIPLENGKLVPYEWVLKNRLLPLITATGTNGERMRGNLRRLILITEWWDSCSFTGPGRPYWNLPGRAWAFEHYVNDVIDTGVDSYNKNYLDHLYRRLFRRSVLVQSRGTSRIASSVERMIAGQATLRTPEEEASYLAAWRKMVEAGEECIGAPEQIVALRRILTTSLSLGLDTTVVLFPRKPATITATAAAGTIEQFHHLASGVATEMGVRFIDLTLGTPLDDSDFMDDYDHVNAKGNRKFAEWALDNDLSFLLEPPANTP